MPRIYGSNGIIIYVYHNDHEPPHVHVFCDGEQIKIDLYTGNLISGAFPSGRKKSILKAFKDSQADGLLKWKEYNEEPV